MGHNIVESAANLKTFVAESRHHIGPDRENRLHPGGRRVMSNNIMEKTRSC